MSATSFSHESHHFLGSGVFRFFNTSLRRFCLFTCYQTRRVGKSFRGGRVCERGAGAIVCGPGADQAAALVRSSHRPIQAQNQQQRRQKKLQRRVALSSGHGERGSRLKDITNREEPTREEKKDDVQPCLSLSRRPCSSHGF